MDTLKKELGAAVSAQNDLQAFMEKELEGLVTSYKTGDVEGVRKGIRSSRLIQAMYLCMKAHGKIRSEEGDECEYLARLAYIIQDLQKDPE